MNYHEYLEELAQSAGLRLDERNNVIFGKKSGFDLAISPTQHNKNQFQISMSVSKDGQYPDPKSFRELIKSSKALVIASAAGYRVFFNVKTANSRNKRSQFVLDALEVVISHLLSEGYANYCEACGKPCDTDTYNIGGALKSLCPDCAVVAENNMHSMQQNEMQKHENLVAGIVGALLGSILGAAAIIVISQLGYVAAISGIIMAVCTLKGYELLGKKLSVKGIIICCILMLGMVYTADRIDWAIVIAREFETDIFTGFRVLPLLLDNEIVAMSDYIGSLVYVYLFTLLGAVPQIIGYVKNSNARKVFGKLVSTQL